ncbi:hypothetical protein CPC08DRAFT_113152 [Agrocybe pediades]|nr:hypothetical protein CPC08DRAFT_113152 [Agrocybe pediades]
MLINLTNTRPPQFRKINTHITSSPRPFQQVSQHQTPSRLQWIRDALLQLSYMLSSDRSDLFFWLLLLRTDSSKGQFSRFLFPFCFPFLLLILISKHPSPDLFSAYLIYL